MERTEVQRRLTTTISKSVREKVGLKEGTGLFWDVEDGRMVVHPASCSWLSGILKGTSGLGIRKTTPVMAAVAASEPLSCLARGNLYTRRHMIHNMPTTKVTRNYQVTIPADVRRKASVERGDVLQIEYDDSTGTIRLLPPRKGTRKAVRLGRKIGVKEIEEAIAQGMRDSLR